MNWIINQLFVSQSINGFSDAVVRVSWSCVDPSSINSGKCRRVDGDTFLSNPDPSGFIPFDNLTKDIVLSWIYASGISKDLVEIDVENQKNQLGPNVVLETKQVPWS